MADGIPDWFWQAVETPFTEAVVEVDECDVRYQVWGDPGAQDLLLVHGMNAHAHWWDFIAPQLTKHRRVAALDLTGMGDSDYRYSYDADTWADELLAVADAAGLSGKPIIVGHSFGGRIGLHAAVRHASRFGGLVMVDSGIRDPGEPRDDSGPRVGGRPVLYPDAETARQRFRLQPPQPCQHEFLLEYIARKSVMPIDGGWAFKFDTDLLDSIKGADRQVAEDDFRALNLPLALIYGGASELFSARTLAYMQGLRETPFPTHAIDGAQHHLFLDEPLEFVEVLEATLAAMPAA